MIPGHDPVIRGAIAWLNFCKGETQLFTLHMALPRNSEARNPTPKRLVTLGKQLNVPSRQGEKLRYLFPHAPRNMRTTYRDRSDAP